MHDIRDNHDEIFYIEGKDPFFDDFLSVSSVEGEIILSIRSMQRELYDMWEGKAIGYDSEYTIDDGASSPKTGKGYIINQDSERVIDHGKFVDNVEDVKEPGLHKDDDYSGDFTGFTYITDSDWISPVDVLRAARDVEDETGKDVVVLARVCQLDHDVECNSHSGGEYKKLRKIIESRERSPNDVEERIANRP